MKSNQFRVVKKTINCFHSNIYFPWLLVYLPWLTDILKSPRCDIIDWHYDRGLNNSKLTVWSSITVADGGMRVWHFNGVITTYGKRDCRNSWRYASLAMNRGAIQRGFTVYALGGVFTISAAHLYLPKLPWRAPPSRETSERMNVNVIDKKQLIWKLFIYWYLMSFFHK